MLLLLESLGMTDGSDFWSYVMLFLVSLYLRKNMGVRGDIWFIKFCAFCGSNVVDCL